MERTAESAAEPTPGVEPAAELGTIPGRRHALRTTAASLTAVALLAAGVGFVAANANDDSQAPLVLMPGGRSPGKESPASLDGTFSLSPYRYRLTIAAPDLGDDAPVGRLEIPALDDARFAALARGLGVDGAVTRTPTDGWQMIDGEAVLSIEPTPGGWAVSYGHDAGAGSAGTTGFGGSVGSVGPDGSVSSDDSGSPGGSVDPGSGGSGTVDPSSGREPAIAEPPTKPNPNVPVTTVAPPPPATLAPPPANLPDDAGAERIARELLERLGFADRSWSASVETANGDDVACAPEPCALTRAVVTSRTVVLRPVFNSVPVDGIAWQVQVGDGGKVLGVFGTWTDVRTLDRYPLRSVDAVFADLVAGKGTSLSPVPLREIAIDDAAPDTLEPIAVAIDRVTLGFAVMPASDDGVEVVDLVPTYVFSGTTAGGGEVVQELVAVEAEVVPPSTVPTTPPLDPPGATTPPIAKPEPQPLPAPEPAEPGTAPS